MQPQKQKRRNTGRHHQRYSIVIHIRIDDNHEYFISIHLQIDNNLQCISKHLRICSRSRRYIQLSRISSVRRCKRVTRCARRQHETAELSQRIRHPSKYLLPADRSANLSFLALWKVTIFHLPSDMISNSFQAASCFVSPSAICFSELTQPV